MVVFEIILIIALSIFVIVVISKAIIDKKHGKCSCDCCDHNCSCCSHHIDKNEVLEYFKKEHIEANK